MDEVCGYFVENNPHYGGYFGVRYVVDLVHPTHVRCGWSLLFRDIHDEGTHSDSGGSNAGGALDSFFGNFGWVDNTGFFEVDDPLFWGHDVDAKARFSLLDFGEQGLAVETSIFHNMDKWSLEGLFDDLGTVIIGFEAGSKID